MEIYFNELSIKPTAQTVEASKEKVIGLLLLMKQLKQYEINVLRTFDGFYAEDLGCNYSFSSFLYDDTVNRDLKILLQSIIIKNPCFPDIDTYEAEMFVNTKYETKNHLAQYVAPEGIAISFINNVPTLSLIDFPYWQNTTLELRVYDNSTLPTVENVLNISSLISFQSNDFIEWVKSITVEIDLNSYENIIKVFPEDKYEFDTKAIDDIISWFYDDKRFLVRIKELIEDISINPFTGGKGKTETLTGGGGKASKRIIKKDRIIYTYTNEKIHIHQCREHY
jgi:Txe/YoeB family toxin of toxin-antitoxin system